MTSEEIIEKVESEIIEKVESEIIEKVESEIIELADKALEQQPCEDATLKDIFCMGCEYKEQEPILDKIRAEIEQEYKAESEHPYGQGLRRALQIIDKHKAESEG